MLGFSGQDAWLALVLSRHPYHLLRSDGTGIASAITQALRRMNARLEQTYWSDREEKSASDARAIRTTSKEKAVGHSNAHRQTASMEQYQARLHTEEESASSETIGAEPRTERSEKKSASAPTALIVHRLVPVLKLSSQDLILSPNTTLPTATTQQITALLVAVLITLTQCRTALLENLERLERDTPLPSIEPHEYAAPTPLKMSPGHDRMRSMSGSTVAEILAPEPLAVSCVSTIYSLGPGSTGKEKEVRWAEKRESDEEDVGTSPKRPKLSEYKQVSSGRVATLMDRFEKFHI
ncbi:hypothetical protein N0V86_006624 [Didymella sp. IMI 355093]|nr:hypothetical protein N0V86_006624 [Didymella sp. IMI 355093]